MNDDLDLGGEETKAGKDPFAETPADPDASLGEGEGGVRDVSEGPMEERLGGEGDTLGEGEEPPAEGGELESGDGEQPPEDDGDEPETAPPGEQALGGEGEEAQPGELGEASDEPQGGGEEQPEEEKPKAKKKGTAERNYAILRREKDGKWAEPNLGGNGSFLKASNGAAALEKAYDILVPEGDDEIELAAIADHYWNPQPVSAEPSKGRSIRVGK